jgi:uncharacterized protein YbjQ (UPF0145 family)
VVGEVLGTAVMQIGWRGFGSCGWSPWRGSGGFFGPPQTAQTSSPVTEGYEPYARAVRQGRDTALNRLHQEAAALGADGVGGVRFTDERREGPKREFMALGTAVRSRGRQRPGTPFTTDLGGQDLVKLLAAGWVPAGIVYGISVAVRHDDRLSTIQTGWTAGNVEVSGYTELLTHVRAGARREFAALAARLGGDAALLSGLWSRMWPVEVGDKHTDHLAECIVTGNAIARLHAGRRATTSTLTILPLRRTR